jgi:16S rRNA pseudouridine516 synthase
MKLIKHLANLGYGSRKEVQRLIRTGAVTDLEGRKLDETKLPPHETILVKGQPLDAPAPLTIVVNKPDGYTCSTKDPGITVYDLLPPRFELRNPVLSTVGRLDKDTTGLLMMTDDGQLLHKLISPKTVMRKVYHVTLDRKIEGHEAELFASGTLMLRTEETPLLPAVMETLGEKEALLTLTEGRYHQVRRMFAAAGNHVVALKRIAIGGFTLPDDLEEGEWRVMTETDLARLWEV